MKKAIALFGLILLLAGIGIPVFSGIMMERTLNQMFGQINQAYAETGMGFSYEIIDYDRRFFSSEIEWKIKLGTQKAFYGLEEIVFLDRAKHGITRVVSTTSLEKNQWFMDFLEQKVDGKNPLGISSEYRYSGNIIISIALDGFDWEMADAAFVCMPGQIAVTVAKDLKQVDSEVTWEGFSVDDKLVVNQVSMDSKLEKLSTYIWDGNVAFSVQNIQAESKRGRFELSKVSCEYLVDFEKDEKALSINASVGADKITGGPNPIQDAFVQIGINQIDSDGFEAFMEMYSQIMMRVMGEMSAESGKDPEAVKRDTKKRFAALGLQMAGAYEKLLKQGLELQLADIKATFPQGRINGNFALGLKKDMTMVQFVPLAIQPSLSLDFFSLKSDFSLPIELVGERPKLLQPVFPGMRTGLFEISGDALIHHAETRNGKLFLNGHAVRLP